MAKKQKAAQPGKHLSPRTTDEKLRGLVNLRLDTANYWTQKELGSLLGISERTIRRYKNQKGYQLAPRTLARIKSIVSVEDRKIKRLIDSGFAVMSVKQRIRKGGKDRIIRILKPIKDKSMKAPFSRILQFSVIYTSQSGIDQTLKFDVNGWSTAQKIALVESAYKERRFNVWHFRMMLPIGVGYVRATTNRSGFYRDIDNTDEEMKETATEFHMSNPMNLRRGFENFAHIKSVITSDENAGRVITEIFLVEDVKS